MELCNDFDTFLSHFAITILLCNTNFSYFYPQSFKKDTVHEINFAGTMK